MVSNYRLKWGRRGFRTTAFNEPKSPDEEAPAAARNTEIGAGSPTPPEGLAFFSRARSVSDWSSLCSTEITNRIRPPSNRQGEEDETGKSNENSTTNRIEKKVFFSLEMFLANGEDVCCLI